MSLWSWSPSKDSTQCSIAASRALEAGGAGISTITTGVVGVGLFKNVGILGNIVKNSIIAGSANAISQLKSINDKKSCSFNYGSFFGSMVGGALGTARGYGANAELLSRLSGAIRSHIVSLPIAIFGTEMGK